MDKIVGYRCPICRLLYYTRSEFKEHAVEHADKILERKDGSRYERSGSPP